MAIQKKSFKITSDCHIYCPKCDFLGNLKGTERPFEFDDEKTLEENFEHKPLFAFCPKCGEKIFEITMHWESLENEDEAGSNDPAN